MRNRSQHIRSEKAATGLYEYFLLLVLNMYDEDVFVPSACMPFVSVCGCECTCDVREDYSGLK